MEVNGVSQNDYCKPNELAIFNGVFDELLSDICSHYGECPEIQEAMKHFKEVCQYNVPHGKKARGITVSSFVRCLLPKNENMIFTANVVGWCIEFLQASFLVHDDIMDQSETRRGQPCWYKKTGLNAVNDGIFLEQCIFVLLKKHLRSQSCYTDMLDLFHDTIFRTSTGQCLDMLPSASGEIDLSRYTSSHYHAMIRWKTSYYSFYLPVASAMLICGINDEESLKSAKSILLPMGEYFQIQDDYLDCFGDPKVTGKIGRDIEEGKCTWLVVQALELCSPNSKERGILEAGLGPSATPDQHQQVRDLYRRLELQRMYEELENASHEAVTRTIEQHCNERLPAEPFRKMVAKIYKRAR